MVLKVETEARKHCSRSMSGTKRWRTLLVLLSAFYQTALQQTISSGYSCPGEGDDWALLLNEQQRALCFSVRNARTFRDAQTYCRSRQAEVLSINFQYRLDTSTNSRLAEFLPVNGITDAWYGYHVTSDRLRKDAFPMPPTQDDFTFAGEVQGGTPWRWDEPNGSSECFKVSFGCFPKGEQGSGDVPNDLPPGTVSTTGGLAKRSVSAARHTKGRAKRALELPLTPCRGSRMNVTSHPCDEELPFVCAKPALAPFQLSLNRVEKICQPDEIGHYRLRRCISYGKDLLNFTDARSRCQEKGADESRPRTLYNPPAGRSGENLNLLIARTVVNTEERQNEMELLMEPLAWVEDAEDEDGTCKALLMDTQKPDTVSWDCQAQLPFYLCQHTVDLPAASNLTLTYKYSFDVGPSEALRIVVEDIPSSRDKQVSIPVGAVNFASDLNLILTCSYLDGLVPEIQTMSIVKGGFTVKELRTSFDNDYYEGEERLLDLPEPGQNESVLTVNMPDSGNFFIWQEDPLARFTDYYWCEANDLKTGTIHRSDRVFFRVKGMQIYAASMVLRTSASERAELILYSLTGYDRRGGFSSFQQRMINATRYSYRWLRFRPDTSQTNSNWTVTDFYIFKREIVNLGVFKPTNWTIASTENILKKDFEQNLNKTFFWIATLQVRSIDICPYKIVYDPISNRTYPIPNTPFGGSFVSPLTCLSNGLPYVYLKCEGDKLYGARWSPFVPNRGCNFATASTSSASNTLRNISLSDINNRTLAETINHTVSVIEDQETLEPVDVVYIADILQRTTDMPEIPPETAIQILEIVDKVNQLNDADLEDSQDLGNATNRLIKSIDQLGDKISLGDEPKLRLVTDSTALEVWDLTKVSGDVITGLELRLDGGQSVPVLETDDLVSVFESRELAYKATDAAILLPGKFVRKVKDGNVGKNVRLSMNVYAATSLFRNGRLYNGSEADTRNMTLNSKVISSKVTVDGASISDLEDSVVTTVYLPSVETPEEYRPENTNCVFWDLEGAGGRGSWSAEGCRYQQTLLGRDVCVCDHLTNFAVLLDLYGQSALPEEHQFALTIITIIGLCLSIVGLSLTIISFLLIPKLRQGRPQQILFNMALAMLAAWVVFLAGFTRVESHVGCVTVAALLHYFILASFMWMLMEGVLQYLLFVKVFGTEFDNYMLKTAIPAWGIPLIPVIVVLALDTDLYRGGDQYCWMSLTPFYYAFLAPLAAIMLANIVIYVMVVFSICRRRDMKAHANRSGPSQRVIGIRASVACFVVLGLSWVFAFFAVEDARVVFQYLFTVTSTLQGFLIFLIFTARDPQVRAFWRAKCCGGKKNAALNGARAHAQGQRSHTGSDEFPLNRSNQSSSSDYPNVDLSRRTSPTVLPPYADAHVRGGPGDGYRSAGYQGYY